MTEKQRKNLIRIIISAIILIIMAFLPLEGNSRAACYLLPYFIIGYDILLKAAKGVDFVEMHNPDKCCGMAGAFGMRYAEISLPMLKEKLTNVKNTGASTVAVACPACMMQIGGGLDQELPNVKVKHVADILAERL